MTSVPEWLLWCLIVLAAVGVCSIMYLLTSLAWFMRQYLIARRDFYRAAGRPTEKGDGS